MKLLVCVKQVPDSPNVLLNEGTYTLNRNNISTCLNPACGWALEQALRLKDSFQAEVDVITMGRMEAEGTLRECASVGADSLYLVSGQRFAGADTYTTASVLALAIAKLQESGKQYDIILCGSRTTDGATGQVGPQLSVRLGMDYVADALSVSFTEGNPPVQVQRVTDQGTELLACHSPVLIACGHGCTLRLPRISGLRKAKEKPILVMNENDLGLPSDFKAISASPTRIVKVEKSVSWGRKVKWVDAQEIKRVLVER